MFDNLRPKVSLIKRITLKDYWPNDERIGSVTAPILFISGDSDKLVPPVQTQTLYNAAVNARHKEIFVVEGGDHSNTWMRAGETYTIRMQGFIEKCLSV